MPIATDRTAVASDGYGDSELMHQFGESNTLLGLYARQLEDARGELQRSKAELQHFAYAASHDLQEPLRKVAGFCQILQAEYHYVLDDRAQSYIEYIVEGAHRLKQMLTGLLLYSRIETQGGPLEPTDSNIACDQAIERLRVEIEKSKCQVYRGTLPMVQADRAQLVCLFENLIGNALKFRGVDAPHVEIAAEQQDGNWVFRVADNGIGIDPTFHEKIFVIFQRLHPREAYSGTGIGLAICKRIVERGGGRIFVESSLGAGSTFCFTFRAV
ncbi:MAG TPA: ATP-binding protein [Lacipirellulaceae bacterium]|nr:ATP-binding protein [Lacipirellulaceae bacterium]